MTAATPLARYSAMWKGALRERLRYRRELHHALGHDLCHPQRSVDSEKGYCVRTLPMYLVNSQSVHVTRPHWRPLKTRKAAPQRIVNFSHLGERQRNKYPKSAGLRQCHSGATIDLGSCSHGVKPHAVAACRHPSFEDFLET